MARLGGIIKELCMYLELNIKYDSGNELQE